MSDSENDGPADRSPEIQVEVPQTQDEPVRTKRYYWTWREFEQPGWLKGMLWSEKGSICWFTFAIVFCAVLSQTVDYWSLTWQGWYAVTVLFINFWMLVRFDWLHPSYHMMFALMLLIAPQIITTKVAIQGFGNTSVFAIPVLTVAAAGLEDSGCLTYLVKYILRSPRSITEALLRICIPSAFLSCFIHNTPLIAMLIPVVTDWCRANKMPTSKIMIPLAWMIIMGGVTSILGTSTNLVVVGLVQASYPQTTFDTFEMIQVGAPLVVIAFVYILGFQRWLLPVRPSPFEDFDKSPRDYLMCLTVTADSPLTGRTIHEAGLRHLGGVFLSEISRHGETISAPGPEFILEPHDRLLFAGNITRVTDLLRVGGLAPIDSAHDGNLLQGFDRILLEAVVSSRSDLLTQTVAEISFRAKYEAAIIGVFRHGERLQEKFGTLQLEKGDTLLMVAKPSFLKVNHTADFAVIAQVGSQAITPDPFRLLMAPIMTIIFIVLSAVPYCDVTTASLCCAFAMSFIRLYDFNRMAQAAMMEIYVLVAASFAVAASLSATGVATAIGNSMVYISKWAGDYGIIFGVYVSTQFINIALNNDAAAATMVPVSISIAKTYGVSVKVLAYTVMFAGSNDFITPIGYQVNTMIWGPGGYKFFDYTKFGLPLQIILTFVTPGLILAVWGKNGLQDTLLPDSIGPIFPTIG